MIKMNMTWIQNRKGFMGFGKATKRKKELRKKIEETLSEAFGFFHTYKKKSIDEVFDQKISGIKIKTSEDSAKFKVGDTGIEVNFTWDQQGPKYETISYKGDDEVQDLELLLNISQRVALYLKNHQEEEFGLSRRKNKKEFIDRLEKEEEIRKECEEKEDVKTERPEWPDQETWINSNYD